MELRTERDPGRRRVSVKTQIVSWKEDVATWQILLARVPASFGPSRFIDIGIPFADVKRNGIRIQIFILIDANVSALIICSNHFQLTRCHFYFVSCVFCFFSFITYIRAIVPTNVYNINIRNLSFLLETRVKMIIIEACTILVRAPYVGTIQLKGTLARLRRTREKASLPIFP